MKLARRAVSFMPDIIPALVPLPVPLTGDWLEDRATPLKFGARRGAAPPAPETEREEERV